MTVFRSGNAFKSVRNATATVAGPVSYDSTGRPTITFSSLKIIESINDVKIHADGYLAVPVSVSGNVVTFKVLSSPSHTHVWTTTGALAAHQHDITTVAAGGGGDALLGAVTGLKVGANAATNTNAVDAGSAGTPDGTNAVQTRAAYAEVADTTNLSTVTFRGEAYGF